MNAWIARYALGGAGRGAVELADERPVAVALSRSGASP
jgi:hypothetical protein